MNKDSDEWKMGMAGERALAAWLKKKGYYVVPTSLIERGGAPLLEGIEAVFVLPDSLASREGISRWIEMKTKTRATFQRNRNRWEHGIPLRHWRHYKVVVEKTGIPGALAIAQREGHRVGIGDFERIGRHVATYNGPKMGEPMAFFDCKDFEWDDLGGGSIDGPPPKTIRPWEGPQQGDLGLCQ